MFSHVLKLHFELPAVYPTVVGLIFGNNQGAVICQSNYKNGGATIGGFSCFNERYDKTHYRPQRVNMVLGKLVRLLNL